MRRKSHVVCSLAIAISLLAGSSVPAAADPAARAATARHFAAGTLAAGDAELVDMIDRDPDNQDAQFGLGMIRFVAAVQHLSQGLYRYGPQTPHGIMLPIVRLPVPVNSDPEPITYDAFRGLVQHFVDDLAKAEKTLAAVNDAAVKVPIDLRKVAYEIDGDGVIGAEEHLTAALGTVTRMNRRRHIDGDWLPEDATVAFDMADAIWLRGYCNLLSAFGEFLLAHEWREGFDASFHMFFPQANLPLAVALEPPVRAHNEGQIADLVSFIHLLHWPVAEPERMGGVREHLKQAIALSRQNWDAIEAETDNDREWVPNPRQQSVLVDLTVSDEQIASWRAVLDEFDVVLDGEKLVPHWRLKRGFNLRRVFEEPTTFDLVLWITGPAALPYLEDGPVSTSANWRDLTAAFGPAFGGYLVWFN